MAKRPRLPCYPCPHESSCCAYGTSLTKREARALRKRYGDTHVYETRWGEWRTRIKGGRCVFLHENSCILHADPGFPCTLGDRVTLGHGAIVHGATVEDDCLIGMRAVVMNGAKIGRGSIVAVGSVVTEGTEIPPGSIAMGQPAKVKRQVTERDLARIRHAAEHYIESGKVYRTTVGGSTYLYEGTISDNSTTTFSPISLSRS